MPDPSPKLPTPDPSDSPRHSGPVRGRGKKGGGRRESGGGRPRSSASLFFAVVIAIGVGLFLFERSNATGKSVSYSRFLQEVRENNVAKVTLKGERISGEWERRPEPKAEFENTFTTVIPLPALGDSVLTALLEEHGVEINGEPTQIETSTYILLYLGMGGAALLVMILILRRSADPMGGGGMIGSFIKSGAKEFREDDKRVTFDDVAGMEQAKGELMEVVEFLKAPEKFTRLGAEIPKGVLLMGSPGTGKTLLAKATAGEAKVPFYSINGSEFIQMFVGVGASRVRDLFKTARETSPCIIFVDEIDAVGRERGSGLGGGHDEREQTLNQILGEMDGFSPSEAVIVIAATNRPDVLDPALLRPGRFDRHIQVDKPNKAGRVGILKVHTRKVPLAAEVDLEDVAAGSIGFSGAELKNLVNEAALHATRAERKAVTMNDFEEARDRVLMGATREEVMSGHERRMTAYHEAGHALIAWVLPTLDPVHKVTIIPRGRALGVTQLLPDEERHHFGERRMRDHLAMAMGGRAAEKLVFDEFSAGAEDDLNRSTQLARKMVAHWGMSEKVGPVAFRQGETHPFLGKEMQTGRHFSDETARQIDDEIRAVLMGASDRATQILSERREDLDRISQLLLERESISREDMGDLLGEREVHPDDAAEAARQEAEDRHRMNGQPGVDAVDAGLDGPNDDADGAAEPSKPEPASVAD
ncbi:ATP-dependent zinc metalloprotease FtsH [Alienimonas californiensis]|uniref:ATP-dependent zinc metalloprotease FtsH n=1 Tax=Alienimonas californiensis TaxID=2527989 RepID=A0A517PCM4_9PLAN|nr:ATP-dependent zinc metalloprotease FtsH [Alienimonas californiensis]QDT17134.1 ATP-dependent zinc metalloprotease FtsH [Alienimonas californiensis]